MQPASKILATGSLLAAVGMLLGSWAPFEFQSANLSDVLQLYFDAGNSRRASRSDTAANTALSIPFAMAFCGFLWSLKNSLMARVVATILAMAATALISVACELPQGWLQNRVPSVLDTKAQLVGASLGCALWWLVGPVCIRSLNQMVVASQAALRVQAALSLAVLLVLFWSVLPGRVLMSPSEFGHKWAAGGIELVPFAHSITSMSDIFQLGWCIFIGIPLGLWAAHFLRFVFRQPLSGPAQFLAVIALGMLPEVLQIPIATRHASATDALFTALGVSAGYVSAQHIWANHNALGSKATIDGSHRHVAYAPSLWFAVALGYWLLLTLLFWYPFQFTTNLSEVKTILMRAMREPMADYQGANLKLLFSSVRAAMLAGLGGLLLGVGCGLISSAPLRRVVGMTSAVAIIILALGIEIGQLLEPSHTGGGIGVLSLATGGMVGLAAGLVLAGQSGRGR